MKQREALLRAGEAVLLSGGLAALSATSVTERAGLARSSFYDYFRSKDDLVVAIAVDAMERWDAEIDDRLKAVEAGVGELRAFIDAVMRMAGDGRHAIASIVRDVELPSATNEDLAALHDALFRPVIRVLAGLGMDASHTSVMLIHGVLGAGVQLVSHGVDEAKVADDVFRLLTQGLVTPGLGA